MPTTITPFAQDSAAELYLGFFGRAPDTAGYLYWGNQIDQGVEVLTIADAFSQTPEFMAQYAHLTHEGQVTQIYRHVLEREPDPDGLRYWSSFLDSGSSIGKVVWSVVDAAYDQVGTDDGLMVQSKIHDAQDRMAPIASNLSSVQWSNVAGFGQADAASALSAVLNVAAPTTITVPVTQLTQWNLNAMHFDSVWSAGYTGNGVVIAQIDTGLDLTNAALTQNLSPFNWNFVNNSANVQDDNGHGTAVASLLVASAVDGRTPSILGAAYDSELMVLKVADANGVTTDARLVNAINYAVSHGASVINISLGGNSPNSAQLDALVNATQNGVIVCMAAGNNMDTDPQYPAAFANCFSTTIAVGASAQTDLGSYTLSSFSNHAGSDTAYNYIVAPGSNVYAYGLNGVLRTISGSSLATAMISAEAADLLSAHSGLSVTQIVQAIVNDTVEIVGVQAALG